VSSEPEIRQERLLPHPPRRWIITLASGEVRTVVADGFRCEHGALVLLLPARCVSAYAPGRWVEIEELERDP
jgi:hypothetical protein